MKILRFVKKNILSIATLFLLAFIPLYPKIPLLDVENTWVYIRLEDLLVAVVLTLWIFLILFKKVKLKTPLTIPIFLFWVIGALSTFHGVLILFPTLPNVFSNVALLSFIRRVEYLSLFFIAFAAVKDKKFIYPVIATLTVTLVGIIVYGLGQKFLGFPAYLTMNEEFAKGVPIRLSELGRVPSTFAGHYDLAAYLVLVIPIFVSLAFAFKNLFLKFLFFAVSGLGFGLLLLTVSRVSFFVLLVSLLGLLVLAKKRIFALSLLILALIFLFLSPSLLSRFGNTLSETKVLVNGKTGEALSSVREVPKEYFKDKTIFIEFAATESATIENSKDIMEYKDIPDPAFVLVRPNAPTGENLPQGTGYVNLQLSPVLARTGIYFTEDTADRAGERNSEVRAFTGNFLVKDAKAYDLSFTTRFQGEWPKTIDAFKRNIFLGSGYGSVSLAVDNNYLRILGETGLLGFISFILLFIISAIFIRKTYKSVDSPVVRAFVLGFVAGSFGLLLNGILIDVFEASKIAFSYWLLMGITLGMLSLYSLEKFSLWQELKKALLHPVAFILYFFIITIGVFLPLNGNYFVGDDFTWLRWAQESPNVLRSFIDSEGFFYRPGAKLYYLLMYNLFWLNETFYHTVSILLHFLVASLLLVVLRKITRNYSLPVVASLLFLVLSSHHEAIFWISATGFLFTSVFTLLALLTFVLFREKQKNIFLVLTIIFVALSPLFHELGIVTPILVLAYDLIFNAQGFRWRKDYLYLLIPLVPYFLLRIVSQSHWLSGDYNYNLIKLPFNIIGNSIGYFLVNLLGPQSMGMYEILRNVLRENIVLSIVLLFPIIFALWFIYILFKRLGDEDRKVIILGTSFFLIALLPFLGLGNITSRYGYLSSVGFSLISAFVILKSFSYLKTVADKYTISMISLLAVMIYLSIHLFQMQSIHSDWRQAGETVKKFLVSFEDVFLLTQFGTYEDLKEKEFSNLYFVNVPIRKGEAWIFPVGLKDALWFALQNKNFEVTQMPDLESALERASLVPNSDVFVFNEDGTVKKAFRVGKDIVIQPAQR
jgi:hypothetical protein